jgi:hypothetical protein
MSDVNGLGALLGRIWAGGAPSLGLPGGQDLPSVGRAEAQGPAEQRRFFRLPLVQKNLISVEVTGSEMTVGALVLVTPTDMVGSPVRAFASVSGGA